MPKILSGVNGVGAAHTGLVDATVGFRHGSVTMPSWTKGAGTPEGAVTAPVGSLFSRTDGSTNTAVYRKETGTGNTGWVAASTTSGVGTFVQIAGDTMTGNLQVGPATSPGLIATTAGRTAVNCVVDTNTMLHVGSTNSPTSAYFNQTAQAYGLRVYPTSSGTGNLIGIWTQPVALIPGGTVSVLIGGDFSVRQADNVGTITSGKGINIATPTIASGGTIATQYGIDIQSQKPTGVTTSYGLYQRGASDSNFLAGNVGLNEPAPTAARLQFAAATTAAGGISFGGDTNLYRSAADTLRTDDAVQLQFTPTTSVPTLYLPNLGIGALGTNLIANGTFDTDLTGWTVGANWAWASAAARHTVGDTAYLSQDLATVNAADYYVGANIVGRTAGSITFALGTGSSAAWTASGWVSFLIRASADAVPLDIKPSTDFDGSVDSVSVQQITPVFNSIRMGGQASIRNQGGVSFGESNLRARTGGSAGDNAAIGTLAMEQLVTGTGNIAIGRDALRRATQLSATIAIGRYALSNFNRVNGAAIAIGENAFSATDLVTGAHSSVAVGSSAGKKVNTAEGVTFIGFDAGGAVTSGSNATYVGYRAGFSSTATGTDCVGVGYDAQCTGSYAVAIGSGTRASAAGALAIGKDSAGSAASTSTQNEMLLGTSLHTVRVPGSIGIGIVPTVKLQFAAATTAAGGILFGTDTNLYRSAADTLRTDDNLISGATIDSTTGFRHGSTTAPSWTKGTGSPEGVVTAPVGSLYSRTDGGTDTAVYRKETGVAATGWVATTAAAAAGVTSVDGRTGVVTLSDLYVDVAGDTMAGNLNLNQNQIQNIVTHKLAAAPSSPVEGQRYYDTVAKVEKIYTGAAWVTIADQTAISTSTPAGTPNAGDLWYDTDEPSGLVLPLTLADGGTGGSTAATARSSLAVPYIGNSPTTTGAPTTGTYVKGDQWLDSAGLVWICTVAGSPGTWASVGAPAVADGPWTDFVPTFTNGITSNGNATYVARYKLLGSKTVTFRCRYVVGSTTGLNTVQSLLMTLPYGGIHSSDVPGQHTIGSGVFSVIGYSPCGAVRLVNPGIMLAVPGTNTTQGYTYIGGNMVTTGSFMTFAGTYETA